MAGDIRQRFRISVYLPTEFNLDPEHPELPRDPIPPELHKETFEEIGVYLKKRFGAVGLNFETFYKKYVTGEWEGITDKLIVVYVDGEFTADDFEWFKKQKEVWKLRFKQLEFYITYYKLHVL